MTAALRHHVRNLMANTRCEKEKVGKSSVQKRKILVFFEAFVLAFKGQTIAYNRSREIQMIILELKYNPKMRKKLRVYLK